MRHVCGPQHADTAALSSVEERCCHLTIRVEKRNPLQGVLGSGTEGRQHVLMGPQPCKVFSSPVPCPAERGGGGAGSGAAEEPAGEPLRRQREGFRAPGGARRNRAAGRVPQAAHLGPHRSDRALTLHVFHTAVKQLGYVGLAALPGHMQMKLLHAFASACDALQQGGRSCRLTMCARGLDQASCCAAPPTGPASENGSRRPSYEQSSGSAGYPSARGGMPPQLRTVPSAARCARAC